MEAIVLAGGFGTRLKSVIKDIPKPMAPINGKPFLEILLETLRQKGFTEVVLSVGYLSEKIIEYFGPSYKDMKIKYEIEQRPLGTGGAIFAALQRCTGDHVFIFNGDTFLDLEVGKLEDQWNRDTRPIIVAREVDDTARYGRLEVKDGQVIGFIEKGRSTPGLINAGCYVFPIDIFDQYLLTTSFSIEKDFLAHSVSKQHFDCFVSQGLFIDIGIPEDYERASKTLRKC